MMVDPFLMTLSRRVRGLWGSQRVRYLLTGGYNTVFGYLAFVALHLALPPRVHYAVTLVLAQALSVANAFVAYRLLVFRVSDRLVRDGTRFVAVYAAAFAANLVALPILVEVAHLAVLPAQTLVIAATIMFSYTAHRRFTFARSPADTADAVVTSR